MRKFLLALIACLVAVIAYATPGSPYLSYGWRKTGGGITAPSTDGSGGGASAGTSVTTLATTGITTTNATDLVLCAVNLQGVVISGLTVSGSTLGSFTALVTKLGTSPFDMTEAIYAAYTSGTLSGEVITASWTGGEIGSLRCQPYKNATNLLTKTQGVDYNVASSEVSSSTTVSQAVTVIGTASIIFGGGQTWGQVTLTADANTTVINQTGPGFYTLSSNASYNGGSHSIGGTVTTAQHYIMAVTEVLGQ